MNRFQLLRAVSPLHWLYCCLYGRRVATGIWHIRRLDRIADKQGFT